MTKLQNTPLPTSSLMRTYADTPGAYTDCFSVRVKAKVSLERFILAFFDTGVFRLEKRLLMLAGTRNGAKPDLATLADGSGQHWLAWHTEDRDDVQLLLGIEGSPIRTWLMVLPDQDGSRLFFGSAVEPDAAASKKPARIGRLTHLLIPFHAAYSKILLRAAARAVSAT